MCVVGTCVTVCGSGRSCVVGTCVCGRYVTVCARYVPMRLGMWFSLLGMLLWQTVRYQIKNHLLLIINLLFILLLIIYKKLGPPSMAVFYIYVSMRLCVSPDGRTPMHSEDT